MTAPTSDLSWEPIALTGGLEDSKAIPENAGAVQQLVNWGIFRGRFGLRAPLTETVQLVSLLADENPVVAVDHILSIQYHVAKMYVVAIRLGAINKTYLYRLKPTGAAEDDAATEEPIAEIWSGATIPVVNMTSFEGGSAILPKQRLYIADSSGTNKARFWNSTDSTINNVEEDFDDSGAKENLAFPLMFSYNNHMFGTDFLQATTAVFQLGLLRFSQPGLIPADEPGVVNNVSREWWNSDHRIVGSRGDRIIAVSDAGTVKILGKRRRMYALAGFDASSFVLRRIAGGENVGVVGSHAMASLPDGTCLLWSDRGPFLTDGGRLVDIGDTIRQRTAAATFSDHVSVEYSTDEGVCYVVVPNDGGLPNIRYVWDVGKRHWVGEGSWIANGGSTLRVRDLKAIPDDVLPGPAAAPSSVAVAVTSDTELTVTWVNGDFALDTETDVHRASTTGFTPGLGNLIKTLASGIALYLDDDGVSTPVAATGALTLTANAANGETVTIDTKVYTFQTVLTDVDGNVLIGTAATDSIDNLIAANTLGTGSGTLYAASTTLHPTAAAAVGAGDTMGATAKTPGTEGNLLATTTTLASGSWGGATLSGGAGLEPKTEYFYKIIHRRNGQSSAASNEASATTALATPTALTTESLSSGVRVKVTNNANGSDLEIWRKPPGLPYALLTTLSAQTTGQKTHDDTTATCDLTYFYKSKMSEAGETDSPFSNDDSSVACQILPDITSASHIATLVGCPSDITLVWNGTDFGAADTVKIYQNDNGGGYVLRATVPIQDKQYTDSWLFGVGVSSRTLRYKFEAFEDGTALVDTFEDTQTNELTADCLP